MSNRRIRFCTEMGLTETQFQLLKTRAKARFQDLGRKAPSRKATTVKAEAARAKNARRAVVDIGQVVSTVAHAVAVFGDEQKASHWLKTPLPLLGDRSPAQILATGVDTEPVDQILTRIEHNIPS